MRARKLMLHLSDEQLAEWLQKEHIEKQHSILAISKECGVSRATLKYWCKEFGIETRNGSEANRIRFASASEAERKAITLKANIARRGSKLSLDELAHVARGKQLKIAMSKHEKQFAKWLIDASITGFVFNYAIGPYNVDFGFPKSRVAIEIDGGNWHATNRKETQDWNKQVYLDIHEWKLLRTNTVGSFKDLADDIITELRELLQL